MNLVLVLGLVAGTLSTFAFIPQVIKTWRSKSSGDLSVSTLGLICTSVVLWLFYGVLVRDVPIVLANAVTLVLVASTFALVLRYRK